MKYILLISIPVILALLLLTGCSGERVAEEGDSVTVHYTGSLEDGTVFDSSVGKDPLTFTIGAGTVITGFDAAVRGMKVGETKTVTLTPDQAYGEYNDGLIITLEISQIPSSINLELGENIPLQNNAGQVFVGKIIGIGLTTITVDANHELAGRTLIFEIELVSIN
ncbi:MAG: peptidylprolyl isomerase [Dehalococcoidales bacterium]|nr:peptidylprolyl isomerase [Dehalococcoidales bacterium]